MPKRVTVIDNYDSFTYNLVQYLETLKAECVVHLNDRVDVAELEAQPPDGILLSPGPGTPDDAGVTLEVIRRLAGKVPILGVCLGHQSIAQALGATVVRAERLMHGKTSPIEHEGVGIFRGLPSPFSATRYHSLLVDPATVPPELVVTARTHEGEIMALRHTSFPLEGVQFHPESILTTEGLKMMQNWVESL
jgi:anthranilate synthase/aminodeoxychorismate synthase-like glutamine amidotransferase